MIESGYLYFVAGGAVGFDTLAEKTVLDLKNLYSQIKLVLALPCKNQSDRWNEEDKKIYECIKKQADKIIYTSQEYSKDCMYKRNRFLVNYSSMCVCYLTKCKDGTAYTVEYAKKNKLQILDLAAK